VLDEFYFFKEKSLNLFILQ